MSARMCMQSFFALLCVLRKPWGIFRELITTRTTTKVAFWDPTSGSKKWYTSKVVVTVAQLWPTWTSISRNLLDKQKYLLKGDQKQVTIFSYFPNNYFYFITKGRINRVCHNLTNSWLIILANFQNCFTDTLNSKFLIKWWVWLKIPLHL